MAKTTTITRPVISQIVAAESRLIHVGPDKKPTIDMVPLVMTSRGLAFVETDVPKPQADSSPLSDSDREKLNELEAVVEKALDKALEVAKALYQINENRLYRENFSTFEKYLSTKWSISKAYGYRLVSAGRALETLSTSGDKPAVTSVKQLSDLGTVQNPEDIRKINAEAKAAADEGKSAAATISEKVKTKRKTSRTGETQAVTRENDNIDTDNLPPSSTENDDETIELELPDEFNQVYNGLQRVLDMFDDGTDLEEIRVVIEDMEQKLRPYFEHAEELDEAA